MTAAADVVADGLAGLLARPGNHALVLGASKDPNAKVTVVVVGRDDCVVKVPTTDGAADAVDREHDLLVGLGRALPPELRATVPEVVGLLDAGGRRALVVRPLPGASMTARYYGLAGPAPQRHVARHFAAAGSWLASFQAATAQGDDELGLGAPLVDRLVQRFSADERLGSVLDLLTRVEAELRTARAPHVAVHGDFWFGNLLLARTSIVGVVDWEAATMTGSPWRDVARFALSYALYLDRRTHAGRRVRGHPALRAGAPGAGVAYLLDGLDGEAWFPALVRSWVGSHLRRLGVDERLAGAVLLAGVAEVAAHADHPDFARLHLRLLADRAGATCPC